MLHYSVIILLDKIQRTLILWLVPDYTINLPEAWTEFIDEEYQCIGKWQDDENEPKLLGNWVVGGIKEGNSHQQEIEQDGCFYDIDVGMLKRLREEVHDQYYQSRQTHEELQMLCMKVLSS